MPNPYITQFETTNGSVYDIVDAGARDLIAALEMSSYVISTDAASTPYGVKWTPAGGSEITGTLVASSSTQHKVYLVPANPSSTGNIYDEYITVKTSPGGTDTYSWEKLGSIGNLPDLSGYVANASGHTGGTAGELAYKDSASVTGSCSVTPSGSIEVSSAGTTDTFVSDMSVSAASSTAVTGELAYISVSGTTLTFNKLVETTASAKTGDALYSFSGSASSGTISGTAS